MEDGSFGVVRGDSYYIDRHSVNAIKTARPIRACLGPPESAELKKTSTTKGRGQNFPDFPMAKGFQPTYLPTCRHGLNYGYGASE